jgi:hypothetical protein
MNQAAPDDLHSLVSEADKTRILVLASTHLAGLGERFKPIMLDGLLQRLHSFAPDVIALESIPPRVLQNMSRSKNLYQPILETFAVQRLELGLQAQSLLNVTRDEAEQLISSSSDFNMPRLVLTLLAALDDSSALLHWARSARIPGQLPASMEQILNRQLTEPDERISIGVKLALELGHDRLAYMDDHHDADLHFAHETQLEEDWKTTNLEEILGSSEFLKQERQLLNSAIEGDDLLPYYQFLNDQAQTSNSDDIERGLYLQLKWPSGLHRLKVAQWEVRNLLMAAHIRRISAEHPGKAILVIVGSSHKPLLDAYLSHGLDVKLIHLNELE